MRCPTTTWSTSSMRTASSLAWPLNTHGAYATIDLKYKEINVFLKHLQLQLADSEDIYSMVIEGQVYVTSEAEFFKIQINKDKQKTYQTTPKQFSL